MFNDFDKEEMMNDEYGFYVRDEARKIPISVNGFDRLITFVSDYVHKQNKIIKKYEEEGKDTNNLVAERDYALYVLGLIEKKPKRYLSYIANK